MPTRPAIRGFATALVAAGRPAIGINLVAGAIPSPMGLAWSPTTCAATIINGPTPARSPATDSSMAIHRRPVPSLISLSMRPRNAAFYKAVGDLYDALGRDRLMDGTRQLERAFVQGRASAGVTDAEGKPDPRAPINPATKFCKGQQVCFATPQGQVITAHIDRVNKVTCTVTCMQSGQGYRVPHALLWP